MDTEPWTVELEPDQTGLEVTHRFRVHRLPPTDVFGRHRRRRAQPAVRARCHGLWTRRAQPWPAQGSAGEGHLFPIFEEEARFDALLNRPVARGQSETIWDLYGQPGVAGLRCVQPFALTTEAAALGVRVDSTPSEDLALDGPYRLNTLWNIDKHRRLRTLRGSSAWSSQRRRSRGRFSLPALRLDGRNRCRSTSLRAPGRYPPLAAELGNLADARRGPSTISDDVVRQLESWHMSLGGWVVPRPASPLV
jgi:hypothetical protein